jgi:hypothetical protein
MAKRKHRKTSFIAHPPRGAESDSRYLGGGGGQLPGPDEQGPGEMATDEGIGYAESALGELPHESPERGYSQSRGGWKL